MHYISLLLVVKTSLHWRHNDHDGVSNHQPHGCLLTRLFRRRSKKMDGSKVIQWFTDNGMQANPSKFQFMVISPDDDCAQSLVLNENTVLVSEKHVQVLGVIIDSKLNVSLHVSPMCKKAARQLNALAIISHYLDESARRIIYNSFVSRNFNYCPLVWHFCGVTNGNKVEKK